MTEHPRDAGGTLRGLLAFGAVLWAINRVVGGPQEEIDPAKLVD